jgi:hypothetical protein
MVHFLQNSPINIIYFVKYLELMETNSTLVIFALIAALGLVTVVAVDIIPTAPEAEATRGCINPNAPGGGSIAFNASKGRCAR